MIGLKMKLKRDQLYIPERYKQVVALHILKNNLKRVEVKVPLLLGIYGPTGEGKTVQCETVLKNMGVKSFLISGGQLDSDIAGQSAQLVRSTYIEASRSVRGGECSLAAVLINDIDTGLGSVGGDSKHTINQLTVFADLMHLVDYPTSVEGKDTLRIPIIITGNDFTKLYEPLVRAGRMTAFEWIPTLEERVKIISLIYPELSEEECNNLINELSQDILSEKSGRSEILSVAFFSHLRSVFGRPAFTCVTASYKSLGEMCHLGPDSPFFNIFTRIQLGLFEPKEAKGFVVEPIKNQGVKIEENAVKAILRLTGPHPCFISQLCHTILYNAVDVGEITKNDVENIRTNPALQW